MTWGSVVKLLFSYFYTSKKKLTLARIAPRNIYLNLFSGAHFLWRSVKACNIAKATCLKAIFPWSYCSLKPQILRLFRAISSKTIDCRFTLKRQKQPPEMFFQKAFLEISQDLQFIKFGLSPSKKKCVICFIESPPKMMKNAFNFILKTHFLSWLFGYLEKIERLISRFMTSQPS